MKSRLKIAVCSTLLLAAACTLVSCKDDQSTTESQPDDTSNTPPAQSIGTLEGTIGEKTISATLNTQDSSIVIEEWDGIPDKHSQRDGGEMSFEAFLLGTDLWNGPPRLVTITHHVDDITLTLRFAGRLAVDERLTALPGCLIETTDAPHVPITKGSWNTAKDVTLPRYDFILRVTSFDESSKSITGVINGQLIDPTKPDNDPSTIELTLTSTNPSVSDTDTSVPADDLILEDDTPPSDSLTEEILPEGRAKESANTETTETQATDNGLNPAEEDEDREDISLEWHCFMGANCLFPLGARPACRAEVMLRRVSVV